MNGSGASAGAARLYRTSCGRGAPMPVTATTLPVMASVARLDTAATTAIRRVGLRMVRTSWSGRGRGDALVQGGDDLACGFERAGLPGGEVAQVVAGEVGTAVRAQEMV